MYRKYLAAAVSGALLAGMITTMSSVMADNTNAQVNDQAAVVTTPQGSTAAAPATQAQTAPNTQTEPATASATTGKTVPDQTAGTTEQQVEKDWLKVSDDAMASMYDVYKARHAIFNGDPVQAVTFLDAATTRINATAEDAKQYSMDINAPETDDDYVPFNANLTVMDDFEPTQARSEHIAKSNEHLQKGEQKAAIEELKLSEVDAAVTFNLIPVNFAKDHITMSSELARKGKFYEANLALKAVDDAVITKAFSLSAQPEHTPDASGKPADKAGS